MSEIEEILEQARRWGDPLRLQLRIEELEAENARLSSESDYRLGCQKAIGNRGPDKQQCDCRSYNRPDLGGSDPEVVLDRPSWMPEGERVNGVPVDFCLAEVIQHLWDNGVVTRSSCCGHNGKLPGPSIVLAEGEDNHEFIRKLIAEKDPRKFQLMQWKLVEV